MLEDWYRMVTILFVKVAVLCINIVHIKRDATPTYKINHWCFKYAWATGFHVLYKWYKNVEVSLCGTKLIH
jgi:hypothetical protein